MLSVVHGKHLGGFSWSSACLVLPGADIQIKNISYLKPHFVEALKHHMLLVFGWYMYFCNLCVASFFMTAFNLKPSKTYLIDWIFTFTPNLLNVIWEREVKDRKLISCNQLERSISNWTVFFIFPSLISNIVNHMH